MPWRFVLGFLNPRSITARSFANPKVLIETGNYNLPDKVPGPRGPVTYRDLWLRQYVVVPARRAAQIG
jgi:hypothetical protein